MKTDGTGQVISYLFRWHHWPPSVFYGMDPGEQKVVFALIEHEIEQKTEEAEAT